MCKNYFSSLEQRRNRAHIFPFFIDFYVQNNWSSCHEIRISRRYCTFLGYLPRCITSRYILCFLEMPFSADVDVKHQRVTNVFVLVMFYGVSK